MSHSKVQFIRSQLHIFLPRVSKLIIVSRTLLSSSHSFCLCIPFILTLNLCFFLKFDNFPELSLGFHHFLSFLLTSHPNSAFFLCPQCLRLPCLFLRPSLVPLEHSLRKPYTKTTPPFLLQSACIILLCNVWGQVPLKCCRVSLQKEWWVCLHAWGVGVNSPFVDSIKGIGIVHCTQVQILLTRFDPFQLVYSTISPCHLSGSSQDVLSDTGHIETHCTASLCGCTFYELILAFVGSWMHACVSV